MSCELQQPVVLSYYLSRVSILFFGKVRLLSNLLHYFQSWALQMKIHLPQIANLPQSQICNFFNICHTAKFKLQMQISIILDISNTNANVNQ